MPYGLYTYCNLSIQQHNICTVIFEGCKICNFNSGLPMQILILEKLLPSSALHEGGDQQKLNLHKIYHPQKLLHIYSIIIVWYCYTPTVTEVSTDN